MKRIAFAAATSVMIATSATAGSFSFSLPNLDFAPTNDVTVAKDCLPTTGAIAVCTPQN